MYRHFEQFLILVVVRDCSVINYYKWYAKKMIGNFWCKYYGGLKLILM